MFTAWQPSRSKKNPSRINQISSWGLNDSNPAENLLNVGDNSHQTENPTNERNKNHTQQHQTIVEPSRNFYPQQAFIPLDSSPLSEQITSALAS